MKKMVLFFVLNLFFASPILAEVMRAQIDHNDLNYKNKVVDSKTQVGLSNAKITIPDLNYTTYSDKDGLFQLNANVNDKTVLFVEKDGYKIFSLTIDNNVLKNPLKLGIEKSSPFDMYLSQGIIHLGDNMFSDNSANSKDFRLGANGSYYAQRFDRPNASSKQNVVVRIGTIIGLDTKKAKQSGQNRVAKVYSSPAEVFVNGHKIGILDLNGDNIEIQVPKSVLKNSNELVIKTGKNLFQTNYIDYDDIELANISIEINEKYHYAQR